MWAAKYYKKRKGKDQYVKNGSFPSLVIKNAEATGFSTKKECLFFIMSLPTLLSVVCDPVRIRRT